MDSRSCKNIHSFAFIFSRAKCRRGVSPIIATLLLVAIATVGGSTVFAFSQDSFSTSQISGYPKIELVKILGYDARDVGIVKAHDGIEIITKGPDCCGISDGLLKEDERIAIYLQNNSVEQLWFSEIRISGVVYNFTTYTDFPPPFGIGGWDQNWVKPQQGQYVILLSHDGRKDGDLLKFPSPSMQPGEIITLLVDLDLTYNVPRDTQFKLTTTNGNIFVSNIIMGQSSP
jgi:flagellin-like protein